MPKTLRISEELFDDLTEEAKSSGFNTIEELLIEWKNRMADLSRRKEVFEEVTALHAQLKAKYGKMADSSALIREDRDR